MPPDPLSTFTPQVRDGFAGAFAEPTEARRRAWPAIAGGDHVLLSAPTGSGKTLAAFLWALDRLVAEPVTEDARRTRLVYVSPLKALSYDIERNLRAPLQGVGGAASVALRPGGPPPRERRSLWRTGRSRTWSRTSSPGGASPPAGARSGRPSTRSCST